MRYFDLLNFQHVVLYIFPTVIFMVIFRLALGYEHLQSREAEERKTRTIYTYPEGIEDRDAPFPLSLLLIIAGTLVWGLLYIIGIGLSGVQI